MNWKERLVKSLPYLLVLIAAVGIEITEEIRYAIVALVGVWFLPSPLPQPSNVSRETSKLSTSGISVHAKPEPNVSRETSEFGHGAWPTNCVNVHGSAEAHRAECWPHGAA